MGLDSFVYIKRKKEEVLEEEVLEEEVLEEEVLEEEVLEEEVLEEEVLEEEVLEEEEFDWSPRYPWEDPDLAPYYEPFSEADAYDTPSSDPDPDQLWYGRKQGWLHCFFSNAHYEETGEHMEAFTEVPITTERLDKLQTLIETGELFTQYNGDAFSNWNPEEAWMKEAHQEFISICRKALSSNEDIVFVSWW